MPIRELAGLQPGRTGCNHCPRPPHPLASAAAPSRPLCCCRESQQSFGKANIHQLSRSLSTARPKQACRLLSHLTLLLVLSAGQRFSQGSGEQSAAQWLHRGQLGVRGLGRRTQPWLRCASLTACGTELQQGQEWARDPSRKACM